MSDGQRPLQLPLPARWLLRHSPLPPQRVLEAQDDLFDLFVTRRLERGVFHAHWRLYHDLASFWVQPRSSVTSSSTYSVSAFLQDVLIDLRYAVRLFARQPVTLLLTVLGLSIGLGIATAAFSIMNTALRGEGLRDADRLPALLRVSSGSEATTWSHDEFLRLREGGTRIQIEGLLTEDAAVATTANAVDARPVSVAFVSGGYFPATGGRVQLGRALDVADERPTPAPPVVVSSVFWTSKLGRDPGVIGRTIRIGRTDATIVGVAERRFTAPSNRLIWMPLGAYGAVFEQGWRAPVSGLQVFGRLTAGASLAEAEAQINGVAATLRGAQGSEVRARLDPATGLGRLALADAAAVAVFVGGAILLVLLLACANVASVLVSTAITREREIGVRSAIGAGRSRIVRQLVTESLALGVVAAAIGLLIAYWTIPAVGTMIEAPPGADLAPDANVFLFLGAITVLTGLVAGLAPAWHARGLDLLSALKGHGAKRDRVAPRRLRSLLVATQSAASVLLIALAALFVRATFKTAHIDVGFDAEQVYAVSITGDPASDGGARSRRLWTSALVELPNVPGVEHVSLAELAPFGGMWRTAQTRQQPSRVVHFNSTSAGYFQAMGLRLLAGRPYTQEEVAGGTPVALVSESLARSYWPDRSPLGELLPDDIPVAPALGIGPNGPKLSTPSRPVIIGVVGDASSAELHQRSRLAVYLPLAAESESFASLLIRVAPGASGGLQLATQRLRGLDPQADFRISSIGARVEQEASRPRMLATLTGVVGVIAIVLCVIGLYGLTASVVGQRTREMGIRIALGAVPGELVQLMVRDSLRPVVMGLAAGAAAALGAGRLLGSTIPFGISAQDPLALAAASAMLLLSALFAVLLPTRRAAAVDAAFVLRQA